MRVEKYSKISGNRYKVYFESGGVATLYDDVIIKYELLLNPNLSEHVFMELVAYNEALSVYYKAIKYLGVKMRSALEVSKYLSKLGYSEDLINSTVLKLNNEGYLSEDAYAKAYINDQVNLSSNGLYKIRRNLVELGIAEDIIDKHLNCFDVSFWNERMIKIVDKKITFTKNESSKKIKEKLINYLNNLGYEMNEVIKYVTTIEISNNSDLIEKEGNKILFKLKKKYNGYDLRKHFFSKMYQKGFEQDEINSYIDRNF